MGKKEAVLIILILLVLFSAGCSIRKTPDAEGVSQEKIYSGTQGLVMTFLKNNPPDKIYDTEPLSMIVGLANKGISDLSGTRCSLYLSGYDESIIIGLPKSIACGLLEPKSTYNPEGGYATAEFSTDYSFLLPEGLDFLDQSFMVTACYEYKTVARPVVCIDPHLYEIGNIDRACSVQDVTLTGGQGSPVSVDRVDVNMAKNKVMFKIQISNKGAPITGGTSIFDRGKTKTAGRRGVVFDYNTNLGNCPGYLEPRDYDIVNYVISMGGSQGVCYPQRDNSNKVQLVDNKAVIYCTFEVSPVMTAQTKVLNIDLYYNYMDSIIKEVTIVKTP
ncbi:hypothetical protein KY317_04210 [Candidatus Woesearchaeota archaeon]|nr:hypothetical protein [Candidatus Woesearchaeota archaeon]